MCGIIGYSGHRPAVPLLVEGLHRLEYRGYDSSGVAFEQAGKIEVVKAAGKLAALEEKLACNSCLLATTGIGHTRWATHALHDGAMILHGTRIQAAGCFLPLAQEYNLSKDLGSRHRAGIGLTETVNVTAIIVSEETGIISIARGGKIIRFVDTNVLRETLKQFYWQDLIG
ncbi:MAG: diadenylate cyclase [Clostridia bacterium]|nr:diadenylate cyclase [Clostridia bacterium]